MLVAQKYVSYLNHSRVERQTWEDIYCGRFVNGIDTQVSNIFEHINGRFTRASNMYLTIDDRPEPDTIFTDLSKHILCMILDLLCSKL